MHDVPAGRFVLPRTTAAVPLARALVRDALAGARELDAAELLTAELVANAVEHTRGDGPIELVVEFLADDCRIEVHDGDPRPPERLAARPDEALPDLWQEHGRGLLLIRTLSSACGHRPTAQGKAVWFTLPLRSAAAV